MPFWSKKRSPDPSGSGAWFAQRCALVHCAGSRYSLEFRASECLRRSDGDRIPLEGAATLSRSLPRAVPVSISSNGGGVIGAGQHESVRNTHGPLFREAEAHLAAFEPEV